MHPPNTIKHNYLVIGWKIESSVPVSAFVNTLVEKDVVLLRFWK